MNHQLLSRSARTTAQRLEVSEYDRLLAVAEVIEQDGHGPKVLMIDPATMVKLFRRKRLVSSATVYPYAARFVRHAQRLRAVGIAAPEVTAYYYCAERKRHLVIYRRLPGESLRERLQANSGGKGAAASMRALGKLYANLHRQGVYFRSLHFGNVLRADDDSLALIDVSDLRWYRRSLGLRRRLRNFAPLLTHAVDAVLCNDRLRRELVASYVEHAGLSLSDRGRQRLYRVFSVGPPGPRSSRSEA